jgi:hypothetical protein
LHINNTTNTVARLHILKSLIDTVQRLPMGDEFVNLKLACHVSLNEVTHLCPALDVAEGTAFPLTASH